MSRRRVRQAQTVVPFGTGAVLDVQGESFVAAGIDTEGMATLVTKDKKTFVKLGADGLSAEQHNGVWTVTLSGTELGATDTSGGAVTVNGTLVCTKVSGT